LVGYTIDTHESEFSEATGLAAEAAISHYLAWTGGAKARPNRVARAPE
jgi:hypothetical protein